MLLLFDIDGTLLLKAHTEHREALHTALRTVHGIEIPQGRIDAAGRTDPSIARAILLLAGIASERFDDTREDFVAAACEAYASLCPDDLSAFVAPRVPETLERLTGEGHVLSLVTGNLEPIARLKLGRAGIARYFARGQGGFGSDHEDRAALPAVARRRAGQKHAPWPRADTVVIGDTPLDIQCARADGVRVIAVASGPFGRAELGDADVVVGGAAEVPDALALLAAA